MLKEVFRITKQFFLISALFIVYLTVPMLFVNAEIGLLQVILVIWNVFYFATIIFFYRRSRQEDKSVKGVLVAIKKDIVHGVREFWRGLIAFVTAIFYIAIAIVMIWVVIYGVMTVSGWLFGFGNSGSTDYMEQHPNYDSYRNSHDCSDLEPDNPYSYGTGHYAGFEWGEQGNYCDGNSQSFIEGCWEYESQDEAFSACEDGY